MEIIYTTNDLAEIYGVKRITILMWINRGYLTGHKEGRDWRFTEQDKLNRKVPRKYAKRIGS